MLKTEILNNGKWIRYYSDRSGYGVKQTDTSIIYNEAIDINPTSHAYEEVYIGKTPDDLSDSEALAIITGGDSNAEK